MARFKSNRFKPAHFILAIVLIATFTAFASAQSSDRELPKVGEGSLPYRSPIAGCYELVPPLHTDVVLSPLALLATVYRGRTEGRVAHLSRLN